MKAVVVLALVCTATSARADRVQPWAGRVRLGWTATSPEFSNDDMRVRTPNDPSGFPEARFHGPALSIGVERAIGPSAIATAEASVVLGADSKAFAQRFGAAWVLDRARLGGGLGLLELMLGSDREGVGTRAALAPLLFAEASYELATISEHAITASAHLEVARVCHTEFGCASWLGEDWVSERGFAWTMVAATVLAGIRF